MSFWSITEQSPNRIVTKQDLSSKINPFSRCLHFALICIPGLLAIWIGLPFLPGKTVCQPSGKNLAECRRIQSFLTIPVKTEIISYSRITYTGRDYPCLGWCWLYWGSYLSNIVIFLPSHN